MTIITKNKIELFTIKLLGSLNLKHIHTPNVVHKKENIHG